MRATKTALIDEAGSSSPFCRSLFGHAVRYGPKVTMSRESAIAWAVGVVACCLVAGNGLAGCDDPNGSPPAVVRTDRPCSELTRALARWQKQDTSGCSADDDVQMRTLIPVGSGMVIDWTPLQHTIESWTLRADDTFGAGPVDTGAAPTNGGNLVLVALGADRVMAYQQRSGAYDLWAMNTDARGHDNQLTRVVMARSWQPSVAGRDLLALDAGHLLDWRPGQGDYNVVTYDRANEPVNPFSAEAGSIGKKDEFRRGHRLVALGSNRLLEWVPSRQEFRVWRYDLGRLPGDIFDATPVSSGGGSGLWPSLGANHELVAVTPDRIAVWNRAQGTLETHRLDPLAADPIDPAPLATTRHARLRSLPPAATQPTLSNIRRLVLVLPQGRSLDTFFGDYCQAAPRSQPTCEDGPACCERMPDAPPGTTGPRLLHAARPGTPGGDDETYRPNQTYACLAQKIGDDGTMSHFASSSMPDCGDPRDVARIDLTGADDGPLAIYGRLATEGTLDDQFFSAIGDVPQDPAQLNLTMFALTAARGGFGHQGQDTLGVLASNVHVPWAMYLTDPPTSTSNYPEPVYFDGRWSFFRFIEELDHDLTYGELPQVSVVLPFTVLDPQSGYTPPPNDPRSGAPGLPGSLAAGAALISDVTAAVAASPYAPETLVVVAWLSSGGFYDHVPPPPPGEQRADLPPLPYGPRVPFLALGPFARAGRVSHAPLEMSSLTAFIEWNFLGGQVGRFFGRDRLVGNLGAVLDLPKSGPVP
jgi:hypothetical protein